MQIHRQFFDLIYYAEKDILASGVDPYRHYYEFGIKENRKCKFNYKNFTFEQLKAAYYHAVTEEFLGDIFFGEILANPLPFYLKSDCVLHLPVLEFYASKCKHITELGVREGRSTIAFLSGLPDGGKLVSYDIESNDFTNWLLLQDKGWEFIKANTLDIQIKETDMIFFDTFHCYEQLSQELKLHADKARKYLAFHDVVSCEKVCNEDPSKEGIMRAINEYMASHRCEVVYKTNVSNGLLILQKV